MKIVINDIVFPERALSDMKRVRDHFAKEGPEGEIHVQVSEVSEPVLVSARDFMNMFSDVNVFLLFPRTRPVREILPESLMRWIGDLGKNGLLELYKAAHTLGYSRLLEVTALILSEDINTQSL